MPLEKGADKARAILTLGAVNKVGALMQNYLAPGPLPGVAYCHGGGVEVRGRRSPASACLVPRNIVVRILVIALEFFVGVREVQR